MTYLSRISRTVIEYANNYRNSFEMTGNFPKLRRKKMWYKSHYLLNNWTQNEILIIHLLIMRAQIYLNREIK